MRYYGATFFCESKCGLKTNIKEDADSFGWPITLKIQSSNELGSETITLFIQSQALLFQFVQSINQSYNKYLEPSKEAKDA